MRKKKETLKCFILAVSMVVFHGCSTQYESKVNRQTKSMVKAIVVIDPGHGGDDGGAVGPKGLKEKDLTLDIALRVKRLMARVMPNVRVVLTREHDSYVGLERRISIAHEIRGDVFLSIHINSSENKEASGFEVYSLDVASDRHQDRLAARENKAPGPKGEVNYILADLRANGNRAESDILAGHISQSLSNQLAKKVSKNSINYRGYNQAIFQVLFVKMPAVLAELFFISNPKEERMLKNEGIRELCARGLVAGVHKYLKAKNERVLDASRE